jgi:class 3 adenylate cyclase/YHS domain-containing protein
MTVRAVEVDSTFGFVDLAGFTALTDAHGDREAVALVDRFEAAANSALTADDQLVKTVGDAVMLRFDRIMNAITGTAAIFKRCTSEAGFPVLRAGLHHGPAVARGHDWFGATVNLAARVAAQARGGQLLATAQVAQTASRAGITVTALGLYRLRNVFSPVELFDVSVGAPVAGTVIDPVCRMQVQIAAAAGTLRHGGNDWWFCSLDCAAAFAAAPDRYAPTP